MGKLDKKVAVITGSARGMGKQMALTFAKEGASIVLGDVLTAEMEAVAKEIKGLGQKMIAVKTDISKKGDVQKLFDTAIYSFKRIDILVNNAAILRRASVLEMTEEQWDDVVNVNLKGTFLCTQAAAKYMVGQQYGKIINISSIAGIGSPDTNRSSYSASKAAIIQLTKSCAAELGGYNINVNAIAPGAVITDLTYVGRTPEELNQFLVERKKLAFLGRLGNPQDIANVALFLASDDSSYMTGAVIVADGGQHDRM